MILYDYDSNAILAEPIKNRQAESISSSIRKNAQIPKSKGMKPKTQILDNECSQKLKDYMVKHNIKYQLATPGQHRANAAERAIRTFKNHFRCRTMQHRRTLSITLMGPTHRTSRHHIEPTPGIRINPKQSAWSQLNGPYDHNAWPLAPPGIHVLVHEKPDSRKSWAPHANDGWYIGPAINHYRSYRVYMRDTQGERITDTLSWFPQHIPLPTATSTEIIVAGLQDVVQELQTPTAPNSIVQMDNNKRAELLSISNRLNKILENSIPPEQDSNTEMSPITIEASAPRVGETIEDAASPRVIANTISDDDNNSVGVEPDNAELRINDSEKTVRKKKVTFNTQLPTFHTYEYVTNIASKTTRRNVKEAPIEKYPKVTQYEKYSHKRVTRASSNHAYVVQQAPKFAYFGNAINPDTNQPAEYLELSKCSEGAEWIKSASEEFGRLAQGNGTTVLEGTNTMRFIHLKDIPSDKKPTYLKMVVADRPEKTNPKRVRNTIGGDRIQYDGDTSTKAAEITTCKIFVNSIISTPGARCVTGDLKDFYLQTAKMPEKDFAYMMIPINVVPPDIIQKYNLLDYVVNGKVYVEVSKGIYGLPQAGKLANEQLIRHLEPFGYAPCPHTAGLWTHKERDISFLLVVDDFAIKYTQRTDVEHLLDALKTGYKMSVDWTAERYCGLILKWDYDKRTCDISMPGYIERALTRFRHPFPTETTTQPGTFHTT